MQFQPVADIINIAKAHTIIIRRLLCIGFYELVFFCKILFDYKVNIDNNHLGLVY